MNRLMWLFFIIGASLIATYGFYEYGGGGWLEANTCPTGKCYTTCPIAYEQTNISTGFCGGGWKCCQPVNSTVLASIDLNAECGHRNGTCILQSSATAGTKFLGSCTDGKVCAIVPDIPDTTCTTCGGGGEETKDWSGALWFMCGLALVAGLAYVVFKKK